MPWFKLGYRFVLRQDDRETIVILNEVDIRKWLPGDVYIDRNFDVPEGFSDRWLFLGVLLFN